VDDVFVISDKAIAQKKNGENYLNVTLSDKSGEIKGVAWDNVSEAAAAGAVGDFVQVKGGVSEYRGTLQLTLRELRNVDRASVRRDDFLPATRRNPDRMLQRLKETVDEHIEDPDIRALFSAFWADEGFEDQEAYEDYIETIGQWRKKFRKFGLKKYLLYASLIPKYLTDKEFRHQVAVFKVSPNRVCFEKEIMDHYRLVFEKV